MAFLDNLVTVNITATTTSPTAAGFGTPLVAAYHTHYVDLVRSYGVPADMVADGFATTDPAYLAASAICAQNPKVTSFKVGRRATAFSQVVKLQHLSGTTGVVYNFGVGGPGATINSYTYTVPGSSSTTTVAAAVRDLINGYTAVTSAGTSPPVVTLTGQSLSAGLLTVTVTTGGTLASTNVQFSWGIGSGSVTTGVTAAATVVLGGTGITLNFASGTYTNDNVYTATLTVATPNMVATASTDTVTLTQTTGKLIDVQQDRTNQKLSDTTADPGLAADLNAILLADGDWYGLALDSNSPAEISAAAAWVETNKKIFPTNSSDYACSDPASTTDVMYTLNASAYTRTGVLFSQTQLLSYSGAAWLGSRLTSTPGSDTWMFKTLAGVKVDVLTATQYNAIKTKKGNLYIKIAGVNITHFGWSAAGEFFDLVRFIDWLQSQIQIRVYATLVNLPKVPYTDFGGDIIASIIAGALQDGVNAGGLAVGSTSVFVPKVATQSTIDRAARNMPNITFTGKLAGAIHNLVFTGTLTV